MTTCLATSVVIALLTREAHSERVWPWLARQDQTALDISGWVISSWVIPPIARPIQPTAIRTIADTDSPGAARRYGRAVDPAARRRESRRDRRPARP